MYVCLGQSQFGNGKNICIYFAVAFKRLCLGTTRVGEKKEKQTNYSHAQTYGHVSRSNSKNILNIILKFEPYDTS